MTEATTAEDYWRGRFDRARDAVDEFVMRAPEAGIEGEALSMWLLAWACEIEANIDGNDEKARRKIVDEVEEYFREGPLPKKGRNL
jgi:hypothetical protein